MKSWIVSLTLCLGSTHAALIPEKAIICGIAKNIEPSIDTTIISATALGELFEDYRILIYENDSTDRTSQLLHAWAHHNDKVVVLSEKISPFGPSSLYQRIEAISKARNNVLDMASSPTYDDYAYVIWADLDFIEPWDIRIVAETILYPQEEWDAVFANGAYDLFAFRDAEFPIGFELLGNRYWHTIHEVRAQFHLDPDQWRKVYSAFGGLGIYKKEAIAGCRYSAIITPALEDYVLNWLSAPSLSHTTCLLNHYLHLTSQHPQFFWFSGPPHPFTCEHINFHAEMAARGHDKFFINPRLISNHP